MVAIWITPIAGFEGLRRIGSSSMTHSVQAHPRAERRIRNRPAATASGSPIRVPLACCQRLHASRRPVNPPPRKPVSDHDLTALLLEADTRLASAVANQRPGRVHDAQAIHRAEQVLLLLWLAADTGLRRGELAALQFDDLTGRLLHVTRAVSDSVLGTPKSSHSRTLTLTDPTARLWQQLHATWQKQAAEPLGPWVFTSGLTHTRRICASTLGHWFTTLRESAGVETATLHRCRHHVATYLVHQGRIMDAQERLGHASASTTLDVYSLALPGTDTATAQALEEHLLGLLTTSPSTAEDPSDSNGGGREIGRRVRG